MISNPSTSNALASLQTESRNPNTSNIDHVATLEMCRIINAEDATVAAVVELCLPEIARTIDLVAKRVTKGGRVVYIGAGTSGRLGVLDASELPPTFSAASSQFIGIIAGGDTALRHSSESAEDSRTLPIHDLSSLSLTPVDVLIGIAASGRTPYVLAGLEYAAGLGALTVGVACVHPSEMRLEGKCVCLIECVTGGEVVSGSTRMKAGTATKILNMISTGVMIRVGKTYGNMMVDVKTSNAKLTDRAVRIFRTLLPSSPLPDAEIQKLIVEKCEGSVKLALVVGKLGCGVVEAKARLDESEGRLRTAWGESESGESVDVREVVAEEVKRKPRKPELVLCIDAGATKCAVVIAGKEGVLAKAEGGPCNFKAQGLESALKTIVLATTRALTLLPSSHQSSFPSSSPALPSKHPLFAAAWIGMAGIVTARLQLSAVLSLPDPSTLILTDDATLLSVSMIASDIKHTETESLDPSTRNTHKTGVVLVSGTGSIALSFFSPQPTPNQHGGFTERLPVQIHRAGGWGYLLGDEGSGYCIGKEAIRTVLRAHDCGQSITLFHTAVLEHLGCRGVEELIGRVYSTGTDNNSDIQQPDVGTTDPKARIAGLSKLVMRLAFNQASPNMEALAIIRTAARGAAEVILPLVQSGTTTLWNSDLGGQSRMQSRRVFAGESMLVMGGGLPQVEGFRNMVLEELRGKGVMFGGVEVVVDGAGRAVGLLVDEFLGGGRRRGKDG